MPERMDNQTKIISVLQLSLKYGNKTEKEIKSEQENQNNEEYKEQYKEIKFIVLPWNMTGKPLEAKFKNPVY